MLCLIQSLEGGSPDLLIPSHPILRPISNPFLDQKYLIDEKGEDGTVHNKKGIKYETIFVVYFVDKDLSCFSSSPV